MKKEKTEKPTLRYRSTIQEMFGLTDAMIRDLGEPDKTVPNPNRRSTKAYLYDIVRVEEWVDHNRDWLDRVQQKRQERSAIALEAAQKRREKTIKWVSHVEIGIGKLHPRLRDLMNETRLWGEYHLIDRGRYCEKFVVGKNAVFAHVRHVYTDYDAILRALHNKVGCREAYWILRSRIDEVVEGMLCAQYGDDVRRRLGIQSNPNSAELRRAGSPEPAMDE